MTREYDMTIAISSFNRDDTVGETLERLFESDLSRFEKIEVIVVDDGSPKPVTDVLERVGTPPEKMDVRLIRQDNAGIGATRNRGFREAQADLVLFLDDDILVKTSTLSDFLDAHREHPGAVIFGNYPFVSHESESLRQFAAGLYGYDRLTTEPAYERVNAITSGLLCVDKSKLGGMEDFYRDDLSVPAAEEYEVIYRFDKLGIPIFNALHISAIHNHHLELPWLADQQFKYGRGTAEAIIKYPEIANLEKFDGLMSTLNAVGGRGRRNKVKALAASRTGRTGLKLYSQLIQRLRPAQTRNRIYGLLASAYYWAGYRDGLRTFRGSKVS